ncbi:MAG: helix-turn-helix transcriptional regulator, partial [Gammaproteobacteria bacterium]|nr:helix-turn-helix transcriptional regulator [Gammaproteobacteria bacterium]
SDVHHILLWFHRGPDRRAYNKTDKAFFEALMPHWQRAIRQKLTVDYMDSSMRAARQVLDQSPFGLHFLNRTGRILFSNAAGKTQCGARAGISIRNQSLTFRNRGARAAFDDMLAAVKHGGRKDDPRLQPIMFGKTTGEGSYQLGMRRLKMQGERGSLATRRVIAVFIYDTGKRMELSIEGLRSLYDLTEAEARVCDLLYQSRNLPEAAKILGISINTAKTHLNRSFRKVGVQSQAELVRRLNSQLYIS